MKLAINNGASIPLHFPPLPFLPQGLPRGGDLQRSAAGVIFYGHIDCKKVASRALKGNSTYDAHFYLERHALEHFTGQALGHSCLYFFSYV